MTRPPLVLEPATPLPTFPLRPEDHVGHHYHEAHPLTVEVHVRCFMHSFDNTDLTESWCYDDFGPGARKIGFALFLLAEDLEGSYVSTVAGGEGQDLINGLRVWSGCWTYLHPGTDAIDDILTLGDATLRTLWQIPTVFLEYPETPLS